MLEKNDIKKIAKLARMQLSESELDTFGNSLNNIVHLIKNLENIDVKGIKPMYHPLEQDTIKRDDKVSMQGNTEKLQKLSQNIDNDFYLVPKVIE